MLLFNANVRFVTLNSLQISNGLLPVILHSYLLYHLKLPTQVVWACYNTVTQL